MARLMAVANGNNADASTWGLIDSTSFLESESGSSSLPTTYAASSAFTPGTITVDGIAVRIASRVVSPTGTMSVELYNSTLGASVAGTEVTINVSDLPACDTTAINGGWAFFKFASPVLLLAATNYQVRAKCSSATMAVLSRDATANNFCRILRTTTTQAPAAGDDRFIAREWTAAGASTTRTVTDIGTTVVDYGSGSTSQATPALSISNGGEYKFGTAASTSYLHKISGNTVVYSGGVLRVADTTTRMPTTSSVTWTSDCVANVDFGIDVRKGGNCFGGGAVKTRWTLLTSDEAAGSTSIQVVSTAGWVAGDVLCFAPTGTTTTHGETKIIQTVDSPTQVTLTAGLTNAHTGTGDVVGEVGNLTSNVKIVGTSASVGTFICFRESSLGALDNVEVQYFGSSNGNKRGVEIQHLNSSTNSVTLNQCVFRNYATGTLALVGNSLSVSTNYYYITNCVCYDINSGVGLNLFGGGTGTPTFNMSDNLIIALGGSSTGVIMNLITGTSGTCTNNRISGCDLGVSFTTTFLVHTVSNISGFKIHSNSTGLRSSSAQKKTITSCDIVSNSGNGADNHGGITSYVNCNFYGNASAGVIIGNTIISATTIFNNCAFRGRASFAQPIGFSFGSTAMVSVGTVIFNECDFGSTTAHTTADVSFASVQSGKFIFNKCTFASSTEFNSSIYTFLDEYGYIGVQRLDGTAGSHKTFIRQGIVTRDTVIFSTASPSLRLEPKSATIEAVTKLFPFRVPVNSGQTCTPTVQVRESESGDGAAYNGARVKLYVAANFNLGITADTLLDTATAASDGAWEGLTGTTAAATDDGVLEFYLTCNGTAGWINADDFTATVA